VWPLRCLAPQKVHDIIENIEQTKSNAMTARAPDLLPGAWASMRQWIFENSWGPLPERFVVQMLMALMERLVLENNVLTVTSPIHIVGDIHGQLDDLLWLFGKAGALPLIGEGARPEPSARANEFDPRKRFLFMGDYVDRGSHSLHTFLYLVALRLEFPDSVFLLRGNHESRQISSRYGFHRECIEYYGHTGVWMLCSEAFDLLPVAALVNCDVFCVHGGLSPRLVLIDQVSLLQRQGELPDSGPLADLCWSDPENVPAWRENTRGCGYLFGPNETAKFTWINRLSFVARSHQLAQEGHVEYFGQNRAKDKPGFRLVTVWSAPNYAKTSGNRASILKIPAPGERLAANPYIDFGAAPAPLQISPLTSTMPEYFT
jgi:diadenosine tetraphosphatase ApaH/serine/threonine PP2A family protein phosphatase